MKNETRSLRKLLSALAFAVLVVAVVRELRLPGDQRTWHGQVLGVPYDLRRPTWSRFQQSMWAPDDPRVVTPRVFGVGWTVNLGRIAHLVKAAKSKDREALG